MSNEELYREALTRISNSQSTDLGVGIWVRGLARDVLNTPPQYEDVEVKQFAVMVNNEVVGSYNTNDGARFRFMHYPTGKAEIIELTGTYRKEVKPKVKRREQIIYYSSYCDMYNVDNKDPQDNRTVPKGAKVYMEWEE